MLPVSPSLWWAPADPHFTGDAPALAGIFGSVSCGVTAPFLWVLVCRRPCWCAPRLESLFPPVLWKSYNQIPLSSKPDSMGVPSPFVGSPGWEVWCEVQNLHSSWITLLLLFSRLFVTHPVGMGFDFVVIVPCLQSHCGIIFVFGQGVSFFGGSSILLWRRS